MPYQRILQSLMESFIKWEEGYQALQETQKYNISYLRFQNDCEFSFEEFVQYSNRKVSKYFVRES